MSVKNNIASLRKQAGLSVYELSKRCGFISSTNQVLNKHIANAEKGQQVKIETALLIFRELKKAGVCTRFEEVFWLDDEPSNQE